MPLAHTSSCVNVPKGQVLTQSFQSMKMSTFVIDQKNETNPVSEKKE
jgi:hypothetical protein